jgi:hypothetical protein
MLNQYGLVRMRKILRSADECDGWRIKQRPPQIGDIGTIVEILHAPNLPIDYIVECSNSDGTAIWVSDFFAEEIEAI